MPTLEKKVKKALALFGSVISLLNDAQTSEEGVQYLTQAFDFYQQIYAAHIEGTYVPTLKDGQPGQVEAIIGEKEAIPYLRHAAIALGYIAGMVYFHYGEILLYEMEKDLKDIISDADMAVASLYDSSHELLFSHNGCKAYDARAHIMYGFSLFHYGCDPDFDGRTELKDDIFKVLTELNPDAFIGK